VSSQNNPYVQRTGYVLAANGENGWFCVFDRSRCDEKWSAGTHQWLVMKMTDGPEKTTRTREEALKLAFLSADTADSLHRWWKRPATNERTK
jgi:hypothetical protein